MAIENPKIDQILSFLIIRINKRNAVLTDGVLIARPNNSPVTAPSVSKSIPNLTRIGNNWIYLDFSNKGKNRAIQTVGFNRIGLVAIFLIFLVFLLGQIKPLPTPSCSSLSPIVGLAHLDSITSLCPEFTPPLVPSFHYK